MYSAIKVIKYYAKQPRHNTKQHIYRKKHCSRASLRLRVKEGVVKPNEMHRIRLRNTSEPQTLQSINGHLDWTGLDWTGSDCQSNRTFSSVPSKPTEVAVEAEAAEGVEAAVVIAVAAKRVGCDCGRCVRRHHFWK